MAEHLKKAVKPQADARVTLGDIFNCVTSHPIIVIAIACLAAVSCFLSSSANEISSRALIILFAITAVAGFVGVTLVGIQKKISFSLQCAAYGGILIISFLYLWIMKHTGQSIALLFMAGALLAVAAAALLQKSNMLNTRNAAIILFFLAFMLRLIYILYTTVGTRQHDVGTIDAIYGHIGYIHSIYNTFSLPDIDVRTLWQYYHPPLHHILQALWLHVLTAFGINIQTAAEGMQFLQLFYSMMSLVITYKICRFFRLNKSALLCALSVVAFHPTFVILSGSVNNDMLSITLELAAILCTLYWYRKPTMGNILKIALFIGLGMMTKLSVWMAAPGIAFVFIVVFIKNFKQKGMVKKFIKQYVCFGVVSLPLGLWWGVRNMITHQVPITYVPGLPVNNSQYVGYYSTFKRLFDFNPTQFNSVYDQFKMFGGSYYEYNPTVGLLKTAMFDEANYTGLDFFAKLLFWSGTLLAILAVAAMIYVLFKKTNIIDRTVKLFFTITYVLILGSYYIFCFTFPHTCTENVRYVVPLIVLGAIYLGIAMQMFSDKPKKWQRAAKLVIGAVTVIFCIASAIMYCSVATLPGT